MAVRLFSRAFSSVVGEFRRHAKVPGVTIVSDDASAERALKELRRLGDRVHGWDTETTEVQLGRRGQTPCHTGKVVCATAYCGDDVDFGNGPMLLIDNSGPAAGLIQRKFRKYFEDSKYQKVFHNYTFDKLMLKREGIEVKGLAADTLVLARIHDTSLASWEGDIRQKKLKKDLSMALGHGPNFEREQVSVPSRAVHGVAFAGKKLDMKSFSVSNLHTISIPKEEAGKIKSIPKTRMGYDLKSLAFQYGIAEEEPGTFRHLFGTTKDAAKEKFDSPDHFENFAKYAALDAVYTWKLFHFLRHSLKETTWKSSVQRRDINELLLDDAVAEELRNARPKLFSMPKAKAVKGEPRLPSTGGAVGTSASVQQATGKSMWDFYSEYLSSNFSDCLAAMQERGILVDKDALQKIHEKASEDLQRLETEFQELLGQIEKDGNLLHPDSDKMNLRSSRQLQQLLFGGAKNLFDEASRLEVAKEFKVAKGSEEKDGLRLPPSLRRFNINSWCLEPSSGRKMFTKSGWPSTSKVALDKLQKDEQRNVQRQLEEKGWNQSDAEKAKAAMHVYSQMASVKKILTSFARPLQEHASEHGRVHPSWSYGTSTGRLTCSNPNLQGLPSDKDSYGVRSAFVAAEGNRFIIADYSQLELRILAHMSQCESMKKHFLNGGDYHSEVAADMYPYIKEAILRGEVSTRSDALVPSVKSQYPQERSSAKAVNFGIVYGAQAQSLAEDLNISLQEAEDLMEAWFRNKKAVRRWLSDVKAQSEMEGKSRSLLGKLRHLPLLRQDVAPSLRHRCSRAAVNFAIQGSGADLVTAAMLQLERHPRLVELGFRLLLQVHDEFVLEGPSENSEKAVEIVQAVMKEPFKETIPNFSMIVPLEVSISVSATLAGKA